MWWPEKQRNTTAAEDDARQFAPGPPLPKCVDCGEADLAMQFIRPSGVYCQDCIDMKAWLAGARGEIE